MTKLTAEQKQMREDFKKISKELDHKRGKDRIKFTKDPAFDDCYRSFVLFDGTEVTEGGWMIGRKWMTAKHMNKSVSEWIKQSFATRADNILKHIDDDYANQLIYGTLNIAKLKIINKQYDLSAGCGQCGGCRWFAAIDCDYGLCFNEQGINFGHITFEHGGCIFHHFIQELLNKSED